MTLEPDDLDLLGSCQSSLQDGGSREDPSRFPVAVPVLDDPESPKSGGVGAVSSTSRAADRSAFAFILEAATAGTVASIPEAEAFLRVLNESRLALGARLGVQVEADYDDLAEDDRSALDYLAGMQGLLLVALSVGELSDLDEPEG